MNKKTINSYSKLNWNFILPVVFILLFITFIRAEDNSFYDVIATADEKEDTLQNLSQKLSQSVAIVNSGKSSGTGFFINKNGYLITNSHVIEIENDISIILQNKVFSAILVGKDDIFDIALLKVKGIDNNVMPLSFATSNHLRMGDVVFTIGNSYNLGLSLNDGIIAGINKNIGEYSSDNFLQTSIIVGGGSSGAPLFNKNGNVVGMINANNKDSNIAFAIPTDSLLNIVEELKNNGFVKYGYLGISTDIVLSDVLSILGSNQKKALMVTNIVDDRSANAIDLMVGDIILSYGNKQLKSPQQLNSLVAQTAIDSDVKMSIFRNGKTKNINVKIGEKNSNKNNELPKTIDAFGMFLLPINKEVRNKFFIENNVNGLYVLFLKENSLAPKYGINEGDIIMSVNQNVIKDVGELNGVLKQTKGKNVVLLVRAKDNKNKIILYPNN